MHKSCILNFVFFFVVFFYLVCNFQLIAAIDVLFAIHAATSHHWVCIAYENGEVRLFDSLGLFFSISRELVLQIASIYKCDGHILSIEKDGVQQQVGNVDCGLFSIAFAVEVCNGRDPVKACFDQKKMRMHLCNCLIERVLKPFPQVKSLARRKLALYAQNQIVWFELFCFCKMPEMFDNMIQCDVCDEWVHCSCAGFEEVDEVVDRLYRCSICRGEGAKIVRKPSEFSPKYTAKKHLKA